MNRMNATLFLALTAIFHAGSASGAVGGPDPGFDFDGFAVTNIADTNSSQSQAITVQDDGKVIVVGYAKYGNYGEVFALMRYNTDGSLDTGFDGDGKVTSAIGISATPTSVALQSDGKIVVGGSSYSGELGSTFALARYNADGSLDLTFNGNGVVTTTFGGGTSSGINSVAVHTDGKIVVGGQMTFQPTQTTSRVLARYNADGSLDLGFGDDGKVIAAAQQYSSSMTKVTVQPDGKILALEVSSQFDVLRYQADGALDLSFGTGGTATLEVGNYGYATAMALQSDGKIVVAGGAAIGDTFQNEIAVVRYTSSGTPDTAFSEDGWDTTDIFSSPYVRDIAIDGDGRIVVGGRDYTNVYVPAVVRYNPDGTLDATLDGDGGVHIPVGPIQRIESIAVMADGRIVVTGPSSLSDFAVGRYDADGSLDSTFDGDGSATASIGFSTDSAYAVAVQNDGKIVVAGSATVEGNDALVAVARYNPDGSLDTGFDGDGKLTLSEGTNASASAVAIQADQKIVVVGRTSTYPDSGFLVVRYHTDGSLDASFDGDGKVTTTFSGSGYANAVAIQPDGKIVVAGSVYSSGGVIALARYNTNGSLDTSFDGDGIRTTSYSSSAISVAIQSDGKIVVAGHVSSDFGAVRFNSNGSPDLSFDSDGKVQTTFGFSIYGEAYSAALQADNKLVVAGQLYTAGQYDFLLVRYNVNGSLDVGFDGDGKLTTAIGDTHAFGRSVAVQSDGKILVAGSTGNYNENGESNLAMARYNTNGSLDGSFGFGGRVELGFHASVDTARAMAIQSNGAIVLAGSSVDDGHHDFLVSRYVSGTCGDGDIDAGETCDDGDNISGDCCSPTCALVADGTSCEDGQFCTAGDTCSTGVCSGITRQCATDDPCIPTGYCDDYNDGCLYYGAAEPIEASLCFAAPKAKLQITNKEGTAKDKLSWQWSSGVAFDQMNLSAPRTDATYKLCVYDISYGDLKASIEVAPSTLWSDLDPKGYLYKDKAGSSDGVVLAQLKTGDAGKTSAKLSAKGINLILPEPGYFAPYITVQLINSAGACWTSHFDENSITKNTESSFKASVK